MLLISKMKELGPCYIKTVTERYSRMGIQDPTIQTYYAIVKKEYWCQVSVRV